jgi:serine/threonine-protein kinase
MIGQTLAHYRIVEKIGEGGMGEVYRARDEHLGRDVALKVLPAGTLADEAARKRFRKEALALAKLNHSNIGTIHDFDTQDGVDFLVMEHVAGVTLSDKLAVGPLPEKEISRLGGQVAEALEEAHEQGVVHRDLKPGNVMVTAKGQAKVLDFGLAKLLRSEKEMVEATTVETLTQTAGVAGTLPYMAPEQLRGEEVDARTDIYALGTVLYEMATGQRAFPETQAVRLIDSILHTAPVAPSRFQPRLSPELERIILKCLDKDAERRYQSARELRVDLERLSTPAPQVAAPRKRTLRRRPRRPSARRIKVLAVLPLKNLSRDPEQEYFADGMTEALIADIAKIKALKVISRTSVMQYKNVKKALPEIARELGVDAVVEGSILRVGDRVRITAQLIHAPTDTHLWAESYARDLKNILSLQSEVAAAIAHEVKAKLTPQEKAQLLDKRTVNPAAHQAYMKGRYFWNQRGLGLKKSIEFFEQALAEDGTYAPAYAGLADAYALLGVYGYSPPRKVMPKAKETARKALEIDQNLAEAHTSLGFVHTVFDWEWERAEKEFQRALEINPSYSPARYWYAQLLMIRGRLEEALAEIRRGLEYDPASVYMQSLWGFVLLFGGRYREASEELRKAVELEPDYFVARSTLGVAYYFQSQLEDSIREFRRAIESSDRHHWPVAQLGAVYAASGDRNRAREILAELEQRCQKEYVSAMHIASIYTQLGEKEKAFEWLEKAYEERASLLWALERYPFASTDSLRSDPRFGDLLRRIGLRDGD